MVSIVLCLLLSLGQWWTLPHFSCFELGVTGVNGKHSVLTNLGRGLGGVDTKTSWLRLCPALLCSLLCIMCFDMFCIFCRYFYFFFHFSVLLRQCFLSWPLPAMPTLTRPTEAYIYLVLFRRMMRLYKTSFLCLFITVVFRVWLSGRRLRSTWC